MSNQHVLKIHPAPLADLLSGAKTAEVRRNDRGFQVGDTVRLMEVNPETGNWTGSADHVRTISHIQTGYGLPDGMCVLSYAQPFAPRNRLPGRLAIRAALPDVPGDMLDHGLFAALDAMGAQAEQQEEQGAQDGDEERPECFCVEHGLHIETLQQQLAEARAALATQPAAGAPVAPKRCATIRVNRLDSGRYAPKVMRFDAGQFPDGELIDVYAAPPAAAPVAAGEPIGKIVSFGSRLHEVAWNKGKMPPLGTELYATPPAAAHGDEAVRKDAERLDFILTKCRKVVVEMLPRGRDVYVEEGVMGERTYPAVHHDKDWPAGSAEDFAIKRRAIDAAMRAQGDGEVQ